LSIFLNATKTNEFKGGFLLNTYYILVEYEISITSFIKNEKKLATCFFRKAERINFLHRIFAPPCY